MRFTAILVLSGILFACLASAAVQNVPSEQITVQAAPIASASTAAISAGSAASSASAAGAISASAASASSASASSASATVPSVGSAAAVSASRTHETSQQLALQVRETERAFAETMAKRDQEEFATFISDEAIFFGGKSVLRGKAAVVAGWEPLFEGPKPPFSWEPERVEVLDSGGLALSTGPVRDAEGKDAGTFISVWRREAKGQWKIIFDKGCPPCKCPEDVAGTQAVHKQLSVKYFNECWDLIDKKERTAEDVENMLLLADASLWHWKQRTDCTPQNLSVGYWQLSRVHALAGQYEMAKSYGERCLKIAQDKGLSPFYVGYGYEALARAEILRGNTDAARVYLEKARTELASVTDKEERGALESDITELKKASSRSR